MRQHGAIGAAVAAMGLVGGGLLYGYVQQPAIASSEYAQWPPQAAAIRAVIGTVSAPAYGMTEDQRREQFCMMFKNRFRKHEPAVAVGIRFLKNSNRIKLMCPARLEPFYVDQIALAAWREARANFGPKIDLDIYDTFIGTTQIKIGQLRVSPEAPTVAHITYDFSELEKLNRPRLTNSTLMRNWKPNDPYLTLPTMFHPIRPR
jgi:hypothetical protein